MKVGTVLYQSTRPPSAHANATGPKKGKERRAARSDPRIFTVKTSRFRAMSVDIHVHHYKVGVTIVSVSRLCVSD